MNTPKIQFTACFAALLDAKIGYTYARWARYLVVSRAAITQWTSGKHVPGPDKLLKVLAKFEQPSPEELPALDAFQAMADLPIAEVTDLPQRFKGAASVADYICNYRLQNIAQNAQALPLQVRLEAISHYAAVTQTLDEHFAVPDRRSRAHVGAVALNMKRFREVASNFDFLFGRERTKPHRIMHYYLSQPSGLSKPIAIVERKLQMHNYNPSAGLGTVDIPILGERKPLHSHKAGKVVKVPKGKKM